LANVYLNELDEVMEEEMRKRRREGKWERMIYTRYADDMVVLIDGYRSWQPHVAVIRKRLEVELKTIEVELNGEKTRMVETSEGGSFGFLGQESFGEEIYSTHADEEETRRVTQAGGEDFEVFPVSKAS
jgi:RNA-directed DNA polymerase